MKYTMNYNDIRFNSSSDEIEAMRRALEIRSASLEKGICAWHNSGVESYVWETPLSRGGFEIETVTVCEASGVVTYSRSEVAQAC